MKKEMEKARFWDKVKKSKGCWTWNAAILKTGYGMFRSRYWTGRKKMYHAHRLAYEFANNIILPKKKFVCHKCDNRLCVRPDHMFVGSHLDNMRDCKIKGRTARGEGHGRSKITEDMARGIKRMAFDGVPQLEIAKIFGVSRSHVAGIKNGTKWAHV